MLELQKQAAEPERNQDPFPVVFPLLNFFSASFFLCANKTILGYEHPKYENTSRRLLFSQFFEPCFFQNILLHAIQTNSNFPPVNQSNTNFLLLSSNYTCTRFFTLIFIFKKQGSTVCIFAKL